MPGFIAEEHVDELSYDFTKVGGPKGVIPEPTAAQMQAFRHSVAELFAESVPEDINVDEMKAPELRQAVITVLGDDQSELQEKALHAIADVCSDSPSFDQLQALPWRHQQAFSGWLTSILLLPQTSAPATNGSVAGQGTGPSSTSRSAN